MNQDPSSFLEQTLSLPCPSCGSGFYYSAQLQKFHCEHCGNTEEINTDSDQIIEQSLANAIEAAKAYAPEDIGKKVFGCQNCGANFMVETTDLKVECGFCGSENVNLDAQERQFIQPVGIIPFYISKEEGLKQFKEWIKTGWLTPDQLSKQAKVEKLHGIYLPFWTYDAQTDSHWQGEAGYYYYETERVFKDGEWVDEEVRKTRWEKKSGQLSHFFDDVLVLGSAAGNQKDIQKIFPYHFKELVNYDPRLLVGWEAEVYDMEVGDGYHIADRQMDFKIERMCSSQLGGDTQRSLRVDTRKSKQTFKHIILPLWISSYSYKGEVYRFLINGQTGKLYGKKPMAGWKIASLIVLGAAVVGLIALAVSGGGL